MSVGAASFSNNDFVAPVAMLTAHKESVAACVAGILAGGTGILLGHPFDTIRVRMQVSGGLSPSRSLSSPAPSLSLLSKVRQLYRGAVPPACSSGLLQGINFTAYEYMRRCTSQWTSSYSSVFVSGAVAGAVLSLVVTPINLLKIQQQTAPSAFPLSLRQCVSAIYRRGGFRGFYCGYGAAAMAEVPGRGIYMLLYEAAKNEIGNLWTSFNNRSKESSDRNSGSGSDVRHTLPVQVAAASVAGAGSWCAVYPIDVVKCRLQADVDYSKYGKSITLCIRETFASGGLRMFYRGIGYTVLRAIPVSSVILPMYEAVKSCMVQLLEADS